jgi:uncharacterized protein YndB with AHSA1/START domain
MDARSSAPAETADRDLVMTRVFSAPRELVFSAWTKPEHLMRWFAPNGFTMPSCEVDYASVALAKIIG